MKSLTKNLSLFSDSTKTLNSKVALNSETIGKHDTSIDHLTSKSNQNKGRVTALEKLTDKLTMDAKNFATKPELTTLKVRATALETTILTKVDNSDF